MHHPTYNESQAEPERINIEEHETKRSGAPASRLGGRPGPLSVTKFPAAIQRRPMGYTHLTLADRIELEGAVRRGDPQNLIAERPCRSPSTLSRELTLNGGREHYRALAAQQSATARAGAARRDFCAITAHPPLHAALRAALRRGWSPEEVHSGSKVTRPLRFMTGRC